MAFKEFPDFEDAKWTDENSTDKENIWDENQLKLIEDSLRSVRNDTFNMRNDKYLRKEADDGGFGASADGFDAVFSVDSSSNEDIVDGDSEEENVLIKGELKTADSLTRIAKSINDANVGCDSASDNLESSNLFDWKKTKTGYDALGNVWDSTVNFLKQPWTSMHTESNHLMDTKMDSNEVVPDSVNLTNLTSSAWENTTHFVPGIVNTGMTIKTT